MSSLSDKLRITLSRYLHCNLGDISWSYLKVKKSGIRVNCHKEWNLSPLKIKNWIILFQDFQESTRFLIKSIRIIVHLIRKFWMLVILTKILVDLIRILDRSFSIRIPVNLIKPFSLCTFIQNICFLFLH